MLSKHLKYLHFRLRNLELEISFCQVRFLKISLLVYAEGFLECTGSIGLEISGGFRILLRMIMIKIALSTKIHKIRKKNLTIFRRNFFPIPIYSK